MVQGRGFPRATARKAPPLRPKKSPIFPAAFPGCNTLYLAMLDVIVSRGLRLDRITTTDIWATDGGHLRKSPVAQLQRQRLRQQHHPRIPEQSVPRPVRRQHPGANQAGELAAIRKEQTLICYGVLACLKGLKEQGCNGPVTAALDKLEKHLSQAAHEEEE